MAVTRDAYQEVHDHHGDQTEEHDEDEIGHVLIHNHLVRVIRMKHVSIVQFSYQHDRHFEEGVQGGSKLIL